MKTACIGLLAAAVALIAGGQARADYPYAHHPYHSPFLGPTAFGASGTFYGLGLIPVPPYFAIHPPVYYSYPVPRTYGYSPHAYPPYVQTPEIDFPGPGEGEMIEPGMEEDLPPAEPTGNVAARGQWIENPFLEDADHRMITNPHLDPEAEKPALLLGARPE